MKTLLPLCLFAAWAITALGYAVTSSKLQEAKAETTRAVALAEQLKTKNDDSSDLTDRAIAEANRAIAQTKEAFALLRKCTEGT